MAAGSTRLYLSALVETYLALSPRFPWKHNSPDGLARETAE